MATTLKRLLVGRAKRTEQAIHERLTKKVALALHNLISSQFPRDSLYLVGFSAYARELKAHELPTLHWDEYMLGTNIQHGLQIAERLLARHPAISMSSGLRAVAWSKSAMARCGSVRRSTRNRASCASARAFCLSGVSIETG